MSRERDPHPVVALLTVAACMAALILVLWAWSAMGHGGGPP